MNFLKTKLDENKEIKWTGLLHNELLVHVAKVNSRAEPLLLP